MTGPTSHLHTSTALPLLPTKEPPPRLEPGVPGESRSFPHRPFRSPRPGPGPAPSASAPAVQPRPFTPIPSSPAPLTSPAFSGPRLRSGPPPAPPDTAASIPPLARPRTFRPALSDTTSRFVRPRSLQRQPPPLRPFRSSVARPRSSGFRPLTAVSSAPSGSSFRPAPSEASPLPVPPLPPPSPTGPAPPILAHPPRVPLFARPRLLWTHAFPPPRCRAPNRPFQPSSLQAPPLAHRAATRGNAPRAQRRRTRCSVMGFQPVRPTCRPCPRDSTPSGSGPSAMGLGSPRRPRPDVGSQDPAPGTPSGRRLLPPWGSGSWSCGTVSPAPRALLSRGGHSASSPHRAQRCWPPSGRGC